MRSRGCSLFFFFRFCLRSPMCKQYRIGSDSCQVNRNISSDFFRNVRVCLRRMASTRRVGIQRMYSSRTCDRTQKITASLSSAQHHQHSISIASASASASASHYTIILTVVTMYQSLHSLSTFQQTMSQLSVLIRNIPIRYSFPTLLSVSL